eukprot:jgi/Galph1/1847/GphlegSOOS_G546.1
MKGACLQQKLRIVKHKKPGKRVGTEASNLNTFLCSIPNIPASQYLVVAFDQTGALETKANKYDFDIHPVLIVGNSSGLSIQNYATSVSRVLLRFIILSPLDSSSIKEYLETSPTTLANRASVSEFLCSSSFAVQKLADEFRFEPCKKSNEKCIELMENDKFRMFCTEPFKKRVSFLNVDFESSLIVGIAYKGRWRSEGVSWSEIVDEAEKFLVPIQHQVLSEYLNIHCMLIVVGTKLSSTVATVLDHESRCYSNGSLINSTFKIPLNCELVILSEKDVEIFIEKELLDGLGRVSARTDKPTLDLICAGFIQQVCNRLAF